MLRKLAVATIAAIATVAVCELALRAMVRARPFERPLAIPAHLGAGEGALRWRLTPGEGRNSLGLRNREVEPKAAGTYRILVLGDSLVWSSITTVGDPFTAALERGLNSRARTRGVRRFEVVNGGVPGYTTYQELEFLKIHGFEMKPDLVVLGFVFDDVYFPYVHRPTREELLDVEPGVRLHHFDAAGMPQRLFANSYLAHEAARVAGRVLRRAAGRDLAPYERREDLYLAWKPYGWSDAKRLIAEMQAAVGARAAQFAVTVFPIADQMRVEPSEDRAYVLYPQGQVRDICAMHAIPMLDLTEPLQSAGGASLFEDYLHLNGPGNDVVAAELERFLVAQLGL